MTLENAAQSAKVLLLFGVLLLCGIDVQPPEQPVERVISEVAMTACLQDDACLLEDFAALAY